MLTPRELGFGEKFPSWNPDQWETIEAIEEAHRRSRIVILNAPPGRGKTAIAVGYARYTHSRLAYITHTLRLATQLCNDFPSIADIRGRGNYQCINPDTTYPLQCDRGPCMSGTLCRHKGADCEYDIAERIARSSPWGFVTNYAKWPLCSSSNRYDGRYGNISLLTIDECHKSLDWVTSHASVDLSIREVRSLIGIELLVDEDFNIVRKVVEVAYAAARDAYKATFDNNTRRQIVTIGKQLARLLTPNVEWVIDTTKKYHSLSASPLWPDKFVEQFLFLGSPLVLMMSATITRKSINLLGIQDYEYISMDSTFPKERRPFVFLDREPQVSMNHNTPDSEKAFIYNRLFAVLDSFRGHSAVVHTVSHNRTQEVVHALLSAPKNDSENRQIFVDNLKSFLDSPTPAILVSASMVEGVDLPHDACRLGCIVKVPYPSLGDPLTRRRMQSNSLYYTAVTAETIMQIYGRATRSANDWSVVVCFDAAIVRLLNDDNFEPWFLEAVIFSEQIPKPLEIHPEDPAQRDHTPSL